MQYTLPKQIPVEIRRMAAAVHEAGHAVVGIMLGRPVTRAMLRQPDGLSGQTEFEPEPAVELDLNIPSDRNFIEDAVIVLLAGRVAEAEFWAGQRPLYNPYIDTHREDDREIEQLVANFGFTDDERARYDSHCLARTQNYILPAPVAAAIKEIAARLSVDLEIGRAAIDRILSRNGVRPLGA
jgi:hypothetical protein